MKKSDLVIPFLRKGNVSKRYNLSDERVGYYVVPEKLFGPKNYYYRFTAYLNDVEYLLIYSSDILNSKSNFTPNSFMYLISMLPTTLAPRSERWAFFMKKTYNLEYITGGHIPS